MLWQIVYSNTLYIEGVLLVYLLKHYMGGVESDYLLKHPVYWRCFARVFTEELGIWSMLCQIVYWNTLYIEGVLLVYLLKHSVYGGIEPDCLLKHPVYLRCFARVFTETLGIWSMLWQVAYWNTLYMDGVVLKYLVTLSMSDCPFWPHIEWRWL
jgi:hypothetical protein